MGLSGYLPLEGRLQALRSASGLPERVGLLPVFLVRGKVDRLVPRRYLTSCLEKLGELGVGQDAVEVHEYDHLAHTSCAEELKDLAAWLGKVVPPLE